MFSKLSRPLLKSCHFRKSLNLNVRTCHAVPLPFQKYNFSKDQQAERNLIVVHGLFGSKANWNSICKAFAQKIEPSADVYAIDARNHGDSPHTDSHSYPLISADIEHFMQTHKLKKASVLGHSMGGRASIYFALTNPDLVEKLVVVDISPVGRIGTTQSNIPLYINAMRTTEIPNDFTIHQGRKVADEKLKSLISEQSLRNFLITNLVKEENGSFRWRINLETLDKCFEKHIAEFPSVEGLQFNGEVLFIGGSRSDYLRIEDKPLIQKLFPNSELVYLDAGHWVHAEKSEEFVKLVLDFLNR